VIDTVDTFEALAVLVLVVLPGASYLFTFERVAGAFGHNLADRIIRFITASAVLQALFAGPTYFLYQKFSERAVHGQLEWYGGMDCRARLCPRTSRAWRFRRLGCDRRKRMGAVVVRQGSRASRLGSDVESTDKSAATD
jgi:uncharacterized protein DUF6338